MPPDVSRPEAFEKPSCVLVPDGGIYVNMADINTRPRRSSGSNPPKRREKAAAPPRRSTGASGGAVDETLLRRPIELLFFAYRDFTGVADRALAAIGFGRAHHRAVYFVGRAPGITVGELLDILRITKQSLAPVLRELIARGYVAQRADAVDRRRRRLFLTEKGAALERDLTRRQSRLIARAFAAAGAGARTGFEVVLLGLIEAGDRKRFFE